LPIFGPSAEHHEPRFVNNDVEKNTLRERSRPETVPGRNERMDREEILPRMHRGEEARLSDDDISARPKFEQCDGGGFAAEAEEFEIEKRKIVMRRQRLDEVELTTVTDAS
jgi:hypothetical protein